MQNMQLRILNINSYGYETNFHTTVLNEILLLKTVQTPRSPVVINHGVRVPEDLKIHRWKISGKRFQWIDCTS